MRRRHQLGFLGSIVQKRSTASPSPGPLPLFPTARDTTPFHSQLHLAVQDARRLDKLLEQRRRDVEDAKQEAKSFQANRRFASGVAAYGVVFPDSVYEEMVISNIQSKSYDAAAVILIEMAKANRKIVAVDDIQAVVLQLLAYFAGGIPVPEVNLEKPSLWQSGQCLVPVKVADQIDRLVVPLIDALVVLGLLNHEQAQRSSLDAVEVLLQCVCSIPHPTALQRLSPVLASHIDRLLENGLAEDVEQLDVMDRCLVWVMTAGYLQGLRREVMSEQLVALVGEQDKLEQLLTHCTVANSYYRMLVAPHAESGAVDQSTHDAILSEYVILPNGGELRSLESLVEANTAAASLEDFHAKDGVLSATLTHCIGRFVPRDHCRESDAAQLLEEFTSSIGLHTTTVWGHYLLRISNEALRQADSETMVRVGDGIKFLVADGQWRFLSRLEGKTMEEIDASVLPGLAAAVEVSLDLCVNLAKWSWAMALLKELEARGMLNNFVVRADTYARLFQGASSMTNGSGILSLYLRDRRTSIYFE